MWSDPDDVDMWKVSPRGAGWLFGPSITHMFMEINNLELICRAHQLVNEGLYSVISLWIFSSFGLFEKTYNGNNNFCLFNVIT